MTYSTRKYLWWSVLHFTFVPCIIAAIVLISSRFSGYQISAWLLFWFAIDGVLFGAAINNLRECYAAEPMEGLGRWQVSITDLIVIALFFGISMLAARLLISQNEPMFLSLGLPLALFAGLGYAIALLVTSRYCAPIEGIEKWLGALAWMAVTVVVTGIATWMHFGLLLMLNWIFFRQN